MSCRFLTANHTSTSTIASRKIHTSACIQRLPKKTAGHVAARRLRCCRSTLVIVHPLAQLLAGLEVRHVLARHLHLFPGLGVAPRAGRPVIEPEAPEPADLDAIAGRQRLRHGVQHRLDRELGVLRCQLAVARAQQLDELRLGHGAFLPRGFYRLIPCPSPRRASPSAARPGWWCRRCRWTPPCASGGPPAPRPHPSA